jgi:Ca-activated chloride channel homolog
MSFEKLGILWLLVCLGPVILLFGWCIRSIWKFQQQLKDLLLYSKIPSWCRRITVYGLYVLALMLGIIALAEPYIYINSRDKQYQNIRLIFLVDVSRSMVYAEDVPPNRLMATKKEIKNFYKSLDGIYETSILPFAGDVNPYFCPFTTMPISFLNTVEELDWRSAPTLGTDISKAIESINDLYIKKDKIDQSGLNIIILFSDGGREEALATNRIKLLKSSRDLAAKNFKIYTVGVGSDQAAPLMVRDSHGNFIKYIMDSKNNIATSLMDEEILKQIAENGNGQYYALNASASLAQDLQKVLKENRKLVAEKTKVEKFYLQPYLLSVTVCLLFVCVLLNKV